MPTDEAEAIQRVKLNQETARIPWTALQRFFAQGTLIWVQSGLDLVEVALKIARDDAAGIEREMRQGRIAQVSDEQARRWHAADASLWAVVVKPWVLAQEDGCESGSTQTPVRG